MLILTRRTGETIQIGKEVEVTVLGVKGNQVRIGIKAPRHVAVDREEIAQRKQREREAGRPPFFSLGDVAHAPLPHRDAQ